MPPGTSAVSMLYLDYMRQWPAPSLGSEVGSAIGEAPLRCADPGGSVGLA